MIFNLSQNSADFQALSDRLSALESLLGLFGAATPATAGTNGLVKGAAIGQGNRLLRGDTTWQNPDDFVAAANASTITGSKSFSTALLPTNQGLGPPTFTSRSPGSKYVFWNQFSASSCDYAMGMQNESIWFGLPNNNANNYFQWFGGVTPIATLNGVGNLTLAGGLNGATASAYGSLNVAGSKAGYAGISFSEAFDSPVFMIQTNARINGVWSPTSVGGWQWIYNEGNFSIFSGSGNSQGTFLGLFKGLNSLPGYPGNRYPTVRTDDTHLYFSAGGTYSAHMTTAGVWNAVSDYYKKEIIEEEIDSNLVLEKIKYLPVARYYFKSESSEIQRIGTLAQAFWLAFKCGGSDENVVDDSPTSPDKQMATADVVGVCLAGIKGLLSRVENLERN